MTVEYELTADDVWAHSLHSLRQDSNARQSSWRLAGISFLTFLLIGVLIWPIEELLRSPAKLLLVGVPAVAAAAYIYFSHPRRIERTLRRMIDADAKDPRSRGRYIRRRLTIDANGVEHSTEVSFQR